MNIYIYHYRRILYECKSTYFKRPFVCASPPPTEYFRRLRATFNAPLRACDLRRELDGFGRSLNSPTHTIHTYRSIFSDIFSVVWIYNIYNILYYIRLDIRYPIRSSTLVGRLVLFLLFYFFKVHFFSIQTHIIMLD